MRDVKYIKTELAGSLDPEPPRKTETETTNYKKLLSKIKWKDV